MKAVKTKRKPVALVIPRKPMARATRVTLFEREVRERLSAAATEILLARAEVMAEGKRAESPTAGQAFFGTIMLTIDLAQARDEVREPCDELTAARIAELMRGDPRITKRIRQVAEREAGQLAGGPIKVAANDVRIRSEGPRVLVDVDIEE